MLMPSYCDWRAVRQERNAELISVTTSISTSKRNETFGFILDEKSGVQMDVYRRVSDMIY
jgi:hypothetical protein